MAYQICKHGDKRKLEGNGMYFICNLDREKKGSSCRFAKYDNINQRFFMIPDAGGNLCPRFEKFVRMAPVKSVSKSVPVKSTAATKAKKYSQKSKKGAATTKIDTLPSLKSDEKSKIKSGIDKNK